MLAWAALVVAAACVCLGYGLLVLRLAGPLSPRLLNAVTIGDLGLLGFAALGLIATTLNVFVPLSGLAVALPCLLGLALLVLERRRFAAQAHVFGWSAVAIAVALAAFCLYLGALIPRSTSGHYDTGLYHAQAIRQIMEYPLILGAANIHMRLGYNSSLFQTAAMLTGGVSGLPGAVTSNALLMAFVALAVLQRATSRPGTGCARSTIFGALVVALAVFTPLLLLRSWAGTPNTDIPSAIMVAYGFYLALRLSDLAARADRAQDVPGTLVLLMAVIALAVTLKLSAAPVVLLGAMPLLTWWRGRVAGRDLALGVGGAMAIGLPWLARGIATSGCIAYPQPSSCLPVPWRIAEVVARSDLDWMRAWARKPDTPPEIVLADWDWFPGWLAGLASEPARPVFIVLAGVAAACVAIRLLVRGAVTAGQGPTRDRAVDLALLLAVAVVGIAFWFLSAPLIRYGQSWLVMPLLLLIAHFAPIDIPFRGGRLSASRTLASLEGRRFNMAIASLLAVAVAASLARRPVERLLAATDLRMPEVAVQSRGVHAGIPIFVPAQGNQCWDAPRICTPHFRDGLVFTPFLWSWMVRDPS